LDLKNRVIAHLILFGYKHSDKTLLDYLFELFTDKGMSSAWILNEDDILSNLGITQGEILDLKNRVDVFFNGLMKKHIEEHVKIFKSKENLNG
jgi:hypothetical protein